MSEIIELMPNADELDRLGTELVLANNRISDLEAQLAEARAKEEKWEGVLLGLAHIHQPDMSVEGIQQYVADIAQEALKGGGR